MTKVSEAQKKAVKAYRERNKEKTRVDNYRRTARLFIRSHATKKDLEELKSLISDREKEISNEQVIFERPGLSFSGSFSLYLVQDFPVAGCPVHVNDITDFFPCQSVNILYPDNCSSLRILDPFQKCFYLKNYFLPLSNLIPILLVELLPPNNDRIEPLCT